MFKKRRCCKTNRRKLKNIRFKPKEKWKRVLKIKEEI